MKQIQSSYINTLTYNKDYIYFNTQSLLSSGSYIEVYTSPSNQYLSIDTLLSQYNNNNVYIRNTQQYCYIRLNPQIVADGIKKQSVLIQIDDISYVDRDGVIYQSGSLVNNGNVYYTSGIIILTNDNLINDIELLTTLSFKNTVTVQQFNINCSIKSTQFNYSTNPSLYTSSVLLTQYKQFYQPYITSIRLYDNNNIHIATTTLSKPMKKNKQIDQTFNIQLLNYL